MRRALAIPSGGGLPKIVGASTITTYRYDAVATAVAIPAGASAGDLMLNVTYTLGTFTSTPAGWTRLTIPGASNVQVWAKYAGGSEPGTYVWRPATSGYMKYANRVIPCLPGLPIASMANIIGTQQIKNGSATALAVTPTADAWTFYYSARIPSGATFTAGPTGMDAFIIPGAAGGGAVCVAGSLEPSLSGVSTGDRVATVPSGQSYSGLIAFAL